MANIILLIVVSIAFIVLNIEIFKRAKRYSKSKNLNSFINKFSIFTTYAFIIFLSYIFIDLVVFKFLGHGYTSDYKQEYIYRAPSPYDMFSGRSKSLDHNSDGFRGKEFKMANDKQLSAFKYEVIWYAMDTVRDKNVLEDLWNSKKPPWKIWDE